MNKRLLLILLTMIMLCPLGLILPDTLNAGSAWGEWTIDEINQQVGYIPDGMNKAQKMWEPALPDYNFPASKNKFTDSFAYIFSGVIGASTCYLVGIFMLRKNSEN